MGEGIVELVRKHEPDLLVTGSRGLNTLQRAMASSVSDYIYHHAKCPVLIVPYTWCMDNLEQ